MMLKGQSNLTGWDKIAALIAIGMAAGDLRNDPFYLEQALREITEGTQKPTQQTITQKKFGFKDYLGFVFPRSRR